MKKTFIKLLTFIFITGLFSCATIPHFEHYEYTYLIDLTKYSDKDFLFTSDVRYSGKYKSCGFVEGELFPEVKTWYSLDNGAFNETKYKKIDIWLIEKITADDIINILYKKAKSINADAVINLKIVRRRNSKIDFYANYENSLSGISDGYFISGFAIKRIE